MTTEYRVEQRAACPECGREFAMHPNGRIYRHGVTYDVWLAARKAAIAAGERPVYGFLACPGSRQYVVR